MSEIFDIHGRLLVQFEGGILEYLQNCTIDNTDENGRVNLVRADLSCLSLAGMVLMLADLKQADLSGTDLYWSTLFGCDFSDARLCRTDLRGANLMETRFVGADFHGADLGIGNMGHYGASLENADLTGANLTGVRLEGVTYSIGTRWPASISKQDLKCCELVEYTPKGVWGE